MSRHAPIRRALLSVSDKRNLLELARALVDLGVELLSTGGTAQTLAAAGLPVTQVSAHTGAPEILEELVRMGRDHGFHALIARIVGGHEVSIALHARCGFEHVGVEREVGRKFNKWLDVVEMQLLL